MIQPPASYYIKLLTSQYANSSKCQADLTVRIQPLLDIMTLLCETQVLYVNGAWTVYPSLDDAFNLTKQVQGIPITGQPPCPLMNTCFGIQLDILGEIVGVGRTLPFQPTNSGDNSVLSDANYRLLLLATIGLNFWNGSIDSLPSLWAKLFPGGQIVVQDNQNMTINVYLSGSFNSIIVDMILNGMIVPRPEGVLVNYYLGTYPLFGFDEENSYVAGFDVGNWFSP